MADCSSLKNLWVAASDGDSARVFQLLMEGTDVNAKDPNGYTALHAAASYGHNELLLSLINAKADVNIRDADGDTPLHYAETSSVVHLLLENGGSLTTTNDSGLTPLQLAIENEDDKLIAMLGGAHMP